MPSALTQDPLRNPPAHQEAGGRSQPQSPSAPSTESAESAGGAGRRRASWRAFRHGTGLQITLVVLSVSGCILTFLAMSGRVEVLSTPRLILMLLLADLVFLLALMFVVLHRAVRLWQERKGDEIGRRLHLRLLSLFGLVAATPTLIISVFSLLVVVLGLQDWLGTRVRDALGASLSVAHAYLDEHRAGVAADIVSMSDGLVRAGLGTGVRTNEEIRYLMERQIEVLRLDEAALFFVSDTPSSTTGAARGGGAGITTETQTVVVSRVGGELGSATEANGETVADTGGETGREGLGETETGAVSPWALAQARGGEIIILQEEGQDRVRALRYLGDGSRDDTRLSYYLVVTRLVDAQVLRHMEETSFAVSLYERLEGQRTGFIITFTAVFVILSLLLFLSALVVGISFANRLNRPLAALIQTANSLEQGSLEARVPKSEEQGEIGIVSRAFNRMASGLARQRQALLESNQALDDRRAFIEAVLGGVSSGVIALDEQGRVRMLNAAAEQFFAVPRSRVLGRRAGAFSRELRGLLAKVSAGGDSIESAEITTEQGGEVRTYRVRVAARLDGTGAVSGYVVTLDDLTSSLAAERKAAWADVARGIAHEIKNPLTPIQLSVERLLRNFAPANEHEHERVRESVTTVTNQVNEIRRLVDEFSDFARMPEPIFERVRLDELVREVAELYTPELNVLTDSNCRLAVGDLPVAEVMGDEGQLRRALLNLVKNAALSISERMNSKASDPQDVEQGRIGFTLRPEVGRSGAEIWQLSIVDNGAGLPEIASERLTEPYVTTRADGSGLGLALVRKIAEVHGGSFLLRPADGGAEAVLRLPVSAPLAEQHGGQQESSTQREEE